MMAVAEHSPALVDCEQMRELINQLGSAPYRQFIRTYITMWEERFARLHQAVDRADNEAAMDVVLSIKISSQMAGAERLASLARHAQQSLALSGTAALASMLGLIAACGRDTMSVLLRLLD